MEFCTGDDDRAQELLFLPQMHDAICVDTFRSVGHLLSRNPEQK